MQGIARDGQSNGCPSKLLRTGLANVENPTMPSFSTVLVSGAKRPYDSWTFVVVPGNVMADLGSKRALVRGTIHGVSFRGTVSRGEGVYRMPVPRDLQIKAGIACGDKVQVFMEIDAAPRPISVPPELEEVFASDPDLAALFRDLPPSHRRAWAAYVAGAKRLETRIRRAAQAADGIRTKSFPGA